jgi:hypothetical protein
MRWRPDALAGHASTLLKSFKPLDGVQRQSRLRTEAGIEVSRVGSRRHARGASIDLDLAGRY